MKIGLAIQQVRSAEQDLADELHRVGERHKTDQEVYHLTRTLADFSRRNAEELARFQELYPVTGGTEMDESGSDLFGRLREKGAEMVGRRPESGLLLLRDLRKLYALASEASINWVILGQGAQATKDRELLQATKECHPDTLRTLKWANSMLKNISPQVLTS
jgi:hypothetical protein